MGRMGVDDSDLGARDLAARAAWMSYVGGLTQDQIAQELGISRQRAQRLVARALAEGLVRMRIDHPIAQCLEYERDLKARYGLDHAWVAPHAHASDALASLAPFAAPIIERLFLGETPQTFSVGTGRTLRQVVEHMIPIDGSRHRIVSLIGNASPDGSASFFEVIMRLAEKVSARHFPMSIPVVARDAEELALYLSLPHVKAARALAELADLGIVGIGQMSDDAPLRVDGFLSAQELAELRAAGAAGEITGHVFDKNGKFLDHPYNARVVGVRVPNGKYPVIGIAGGERKRTAIRAALTGGLLAGVVTDEATARALLNG